MSIGQHGVLRMSSGKLIVIEGLDNSGRSLHCGLLSDRLEAHGIATKTIGLARSKLMGDLLKSRSSDIHQLGWRTRFLLYATDLHDQIIHEVEPLLKAGFVVIADRYTLTPKIREVARGASPEWVDAVYKDVPKPDAVVILHAGPRRLLNRIMFGEKLESLNHFESGMDLGLSSSRTTSFLQYQKMLRKSFLAEGEKIGATMVPTKHDVDVVHDEIWNAILPVVERIIQPIGDR